MTSQCLNQAQGAVRGWNDPTDGLPGMTLPRLDGRVLDRPRLRELIDSSLALAVVRGPSGSGKTVLANQWARHARRRGDIVHWLDGSYMSAAEVLTALDQILVPEPSVRPAEVLAEPDLSQLWQAARLLADDLAVVIDNFDPVADELGKVIVELTRATDSLRFVICLRGQPDFAEHAGLDVRTVRSEDLLFTSEDCRDLATSFGTDLSETDIEDVMAATAGWSALVNVGFVDGTWSEGSVRRFVVETLLPALSDGTRALLVRLSFIEYLVLESAEVLGASAAAEALDDLELLGVLDRRSDGDRTVFHMPLALRQLLRSEHDEAVHGSLSDLHMRVADRLVELGLIGKALEQAYAGESWLKVVEVVGLRPWEVLSSHGSLLARVFRDVPTSLVAANPTAELVRCTLDRAVATELVLPKLPVQDRELTDLVAQGNAVATLDQLALLSIVLRRRADLSKVREIADVGQRLVALVPGEDARLAGARLSINVGVADLWGGRVVEATARFESAYADDPTEQLAMRREAAVYSGLAHAILGHAQISNEWLQRAERIGRGGSVAVLDIDLAAAIAKAIIAVDSGSGDGVPEAVSTYSSRVVQSELWPIALWTRVRSTMLSGGRHELLGRLETERMANSEYIVAGTLIEAVVDASHAELLMSLGRGPDARRIMESQGSIHAVVVLARARLAQLEGSPEEAISFASKAIQDAQAIPRVRCEAMIVAAAALDSLGRRDESQLMLEAAARTASRHSFPNSFASIPRDLLRSYVDQAPDLEPIIQDLDRRHLVQLFPTRIETVRLTPREAEVLRGLSLGYSADQIAHTLFVSKNTIKSQTASLYRKLNVNSRNAAVARAQELRLVN